VFDQETARSRLNSERDEVAARIGALTREFDAIVASAAAGSAGGDDEHDPEGATVAFERQHVAALLEQARARLGAVDAAQRKLDSGGYETCDVCGGPIGAQRLAARPAALTCVRCAARSERANRGG
jgi:DnaK suppressor protein